MINRVPLLAQQGEPSSGGVMNHPLSLIIEPSQAIGNVEPSGLAV